VNEVRRIEVLRSYDVLDTACEEAFDDIARLAARLTGCPTAIISLVDTDRQWFKARHGMEATQTPRADALCAWAILGSAPMVLEDLAADPRSADSVVLTRDGFRFYAGAPLMTPEGVALGTLCVLDKRRRAMSDEQTDTLRGLARTVVTALELRRAMRGARELALTDSLTELGNRIGFFVALRDAMQRAAGGFGVAFVDLDGFKGVNDQFGHETGDLVLRALAQTLRDQVRAGDYVARLGGDEFGLVVSAEERTGFEVLARRLVAAVAACPKGHGVTASVGAVWCGGRDGDPGAVMRQADALMYAAKLAGKNRVVFG
jgi:diguanylate cyclase (GGDEF)-like protein